MWRVLISGSHATSPCRHQAFPFSRVIWTSYHRWHFLFVCLCFSLSLSSSPFMSQFKSYIQEGFPEHLDRVLWSYILLYLTCPLLRLSTSRIYHLCAISFRALSTWTPFLHSYELYIEYKAWLPFLTFQRLGPGYQITLLAKYGHEYWDLANQGTPQGLSITASV